MLNQLDKNKIALQFNKAADSYDKAAVLQRTVGSILLDRLQGIRIKPQTILDLGCGTGHAITTLKKNYPFAEIIGFDQSFEMLKKVYGQQVIKKSVKIHCINGQAESLPFNSNSFELVYSSLMLHWSTDFLGTLDEIYRTLRPGGLFLFSIVGADTLKELRHAWTKVDNKPHVHVFPDMHDIGDNLLATRFIDPVMDVDYFSTLYSDIFSLMTDLKELGVQNLSVDRHRGLTSKSSLQKLIEAYDFFRTLSGKLPASWEIVYGHAWVGMKKITNISQYTNEVRISIDKIRRQKKK